MEPLFSPPTPNFPEIIRQAAFEQRPLFIRYAGGHEAGRWRLILPDSLSLEEAGQLFRGWCLRRQACRTFRLDRVTDVAQPEGEAIAGFPIYRASGELDRVHLPSKAHLIYE